MRDKKVAVLGAGSWGTALAMSLARSGHEVSLWGRNPEVMAEMEKSRENRKYLPDAVLPDGISCTADAREAISEACAAVYVVPAQAFRSCFEATNRYVKGDVPVINCAKGVERGTHMLISQIAAQIRPDVRYAVLSGPSHAEELAKALPTMLTAAAEEEKTAVFVQDLFMTDGLRIYTSGDVTGTEIGGALKNIIALGAGISDGMGYGDNAKAALMTRGLTEIARLGVEMGAERSNFMGLSGVGDLIVTCTSMHSRNRRCGIMIGEGLKPEEATKKVGMVVEGMFTTEAAYELAKSHGVEMPITEQIYRVIRGEVPAAAAVDLLMGRERKRED